MKIRDNNEARRHVSSQQRGSLARGKIRMKCVTGTLNSRTDTGTPIASGCNASKVIRRRDSDQGGSRGGLGIACRFLGHFAGVRGGGTTVNGHAGDAGGACGTSGYATPTQAATAWLNQATRWSNSNSGGISGGSLPVRQRLERVAAPRRSAHLRDRLRIADLPGVRYKQGCRHTDTRSER